MAKQLAEQEYSKFHQERLSNEADRADEYLGQLAKGAQIDRE